jgi:hypothetical protein
MITADIVVVTLVLNNNVTAEGSFLGLPQTLQMLAQSDGPSDTFRTTFSFSVISNTGLGFTLRISPR